MVSLLFYKLLFGTPFFQHKLKTYVDLQIYASWNSYLCAQTYSPLLSFSHTCSSHWSSVIQIREPISSSGPLDYLSLCLELSSDSLLHVSLYLNVIPLEKLCDHSIKHHSPVTLHGSVLILSIALNAISKFISLSLSLCMSISVSIYLSLPFFLPSFLLSFFLPHSLLASFPSSLFLSFFFFV